MVELEEDWESSLRVWDFALPGASTLFVVVPELSPFKPTWFEPTWVTPAWVEPILDLSGAALPAVPCKLAESKFPEPVTGGTIAETLAGVAKTCSISDFTAASVLPVASEVSTVPRVML
jgi:hypothetical protein